MTGPELHGGASEAVPEQTITARGAGGVGAASMVAAVAGYIVLLIAARTLQPAANAEFLTFWALLFGLFGAMGGVQNETTRAVRVGGAPRGARVVPFGLGIGAGVAALVAASAWWWAPGLLGESWAARAGVVALGVAAFAGHSSIVGALAGTRAWTAYSRLVALESATRLLLVAAAALVGAGLLGLETAVAAASGVWLVVMITSPRTRATWGLRADVGVRRLGRNVGHSVVASASSAALVVGFAVLLRVSSDAAEFSRAAPLLLAVSLTRAPLMIPLTAYQGVAITYFLAHRDRGMAALRRVLLLIAAVGAAASAAAWLVGPWLMTLMFGDDYVVSGAVMGGLTLSAAALGVVTFTGAAALALGRHTAYAVGWLAATVASALVLFAASGTLEQRSILALLAGPAVGFVIHVVALQRPARQAPGPGDA